MFDSRDTLHEHIAAFTGIESAVLMGRSPLNCSVFARMSWAVGRSTSRIEDRAYSLMGLFGVFMPMLYGEGERAFRRLQEEIMKQNEDYTMFTWQSPDLTAAYSGLLAKSADMFHIPFLTTLASTVYSNSFSLKHHLIADREPPIMTSRGIKISLPLLELDNAIESDLNASDLVFSPRSTNRSVKGHRYTVKKSDTTFPRLTRIWLAMISWMRQDRQDRPTEQELLCIYLRQTIGEQTVLRLSPSEVVRVPVKYASLFKVENIYAAA